MSAGLDAKYFLILCDDSLTDSSQNKKYHICNSFKEVSDEIKKYKSARFKIFDSEEKAVKYAKHYYQKKLNTFFDSCVSDNKSSDEKPLPFKLPTASEIARFRIILNEGKVDELERFLFSNPRLLISQGDTPVILQEGARYHALHFCAQKCEPVSTDLCRIILKTLEDDNFYLKLYPDDSEYTLQNRKKFLTDLYLNMPDKLLFETPLHMASKFGNIHMVETLASHPLTDKLCLNKDGLNAEEIICNRYNGKDKREMQAKILEIIEGQYYVPIYREGASSLSQNHHITKPYYKISQTHNLSTINPHLSSPLMGKPFKANSSLAELFTNVDHELRNTKDFFKIEKGHQTPEFEHTSGNFYTPQGFNFSPDENISAHYRIDALAGPLNQNKALEFCQLLNKARKGSLKYITQISSKNILSPTQNLISATSNKTSYVTTPKPSQFNFDDFKFTTPFKLDAVLRDPEKGVEMLGRHIAQSLNVPWYERWHFFDTCPDLGDMNQPLPLQIQNKSTNSINYVNPPSFNTSLNLPQALNLDNITSPSGLAKFEKYLSTKHQASLLNSKNFPTLLSSNSSLSCSPLKFDSLDGANYISSIKTTNDEIGPTTHASQLSTSSAQKFNKYRDTPEADILDDEAEKASVDTHDINFNKDVNSEDCLEPLETVANLFHDKFMNELNPNENVKGDIEKNLIANVKDDELASICTNFEKLHLTYGPYNSSEGIALKTSGKDKDDSALSTEQSIKSIHTSPSNILAKGDHINIDSSTHHDISPLKRRFSRLFSLDTCQTNDSSLNSTNTYKNLIDQKFIASPKFFTRSRPKINMAPINECTSNEFLRESSPSKLLKLSPSILKVNKNKDNLNESDNVEPINKLNEASSSFICNIINSSTQWVHSNIKNKFTSFFAQPESIATKDNLSSLDEKESGDPSSPPLSFFTPPESPISVKAVPNIVISIKDALNRPDHSFLDQTSLEHISETGKLIASTPYAKNKFNYQSHSSLDNTVFIDGGLHPTKIDQDVYSCFHLSFGNNKGDWNDSDLIHFPHVLAWYRAMQHTEFGANLMGMASISENNIALQNTSL